MTTNNTSLTIGIVDPSSTKMIDLSNTQYILNWIAGGGNQKYSDSSGNNLVKSLIQPENLELQYNIPDNKISFYFTDPCNNNISIRDAQTIANKNVQEPESGETLYTYPMSKNYICLVSSDEYQSNGKKYYRNNIYLKRKNIKNGPNNPDTSFNDFILANCIPYLSLGNNQGNIVKRNDDVTDGSSSVIFYEFGFDISGNLSRKNLYSISGADHITGDISRNVNNLFPPIKDLSHNYTWLGINTVKISNSNSGIKYTTKFNSLNNQDVTVVNKGVQSIDISNNTLTLIDTICPNTTNLLNDLGFNKTSWFSSGQDVNTTQGHFVGQFVFDESANGTMIYQYYYSEKLSDNLPDETSPYNIYFNISGGKLQFPEQWPDIILDISNESTLSSKLPWARESTGILANIYADIFKQEGLRWYYNNIENTDNVQYKEWTNFKINDLSCAKTELGNWASFSNIEKNSRKQIYEHAYNSVIGILRTSFPALNESFSISTFHDISRSIYNSDITSNQSTIEYIWDTSASITANQTYNIVNYPKLKFIAFNNLQSITADNIFYNNKYINRIILPASLTDISTNTFANLENINTLIFMGNKLSNFEDMSFNTTNLKNIYYSEGKDDWIDTSLNHTNNIGSLVNTTISPLPYNNNKITIKY